MCVRPSTGEPPTSLCFVQCVGSRDRHIGNEYCSKVCCGVASKEAIEVRQLLPDCKVYIFYIDMRMYGYWENEIYWAAQEKHHVQYVKGIITEVLAKGDQLIVRGEDTTMGRPMELLMDMVVLSVGMEPSAGTREVARILGIRPNRFGFIDAVEAPLDPVATSREGIYACGAALGPADLEDTVSSAANAAMRAVAFVRGHAAAPAGSCRRSMIAGQVVDTATAAEFFQQVLAVSTRDELSGIGEDAATQVCRDASPRRRRSVHHGRRRPA